MTLTSMKSNLEYRETDDVPTTGLGRCMIRPVPDGAGAQPVVITGIGVLASNGLGREAFWESIKLGRSGIRQVTCFNASDLPTRIGGELWDFTPGDFMTKKVVRNWHRHVHQGVAASRLATQDADLKSARYAPERVAVAIGTSIGSPSEAYQRNLDALRSGGYKKLSPYASSAFSGHAATVHVTVDFGFKGPALTISSGCATGLDVLAWGCHQIRAGNVDAALVGATECPIFYENFAMGCAMGILSKRNDEPAKAMRPFDRQRDGIVLSEGACVFVLERADHAWSRGARTFAEVLSTGSAAEGRSPFILERKGEALARAITVALRNAGLRTDELDYIQAHGASLETYDHCETNAYKRALGTHAYRVPISAVKSMIGQPYSAGGVLGMAAAVQALSEGVVSPTVNIEDPDPACDLDYVPNTARINDVQTALVTAMSFGGTHTAAILRNVAV